MRSKEHIEENRVACNCPERDVAEVEAHDRRLASDKSTPGLIDFFQRGMAQNNGDSGGDQAEERKKDAGEPHVHTLPG